MNLIFRKAVPDDMERIWRIISDAKSFMAANGRNQWDESYPLPENIEKDISDGTAYVAECNGLAAYASIVFDGEPSYDRIVGRWSDSLPYVVIHRLAVSSCFKGQGIAKRFMRYAEELAIARNVFRFRADTNFDNKEMLAIFEKSGFRYCGKIYYSDCGRNAERLAYEKIIGAV